uniref:Defensin-like protein b n=2 Tax=Arabidopsis lyrata TaxID=59689 RepID=SCRB_ARALY|nr:RecName: Full=Defensin-like protein b; AltName: Full=S locus cysteine-rich-like protein b; Flags: Precursor [Arabidopsis lyrata]ADQ37355.1 unknown [Arabidopsis lyrata]BAB40985.1 SCRb [Arabidopsis lyrata]
MRNATFFIVFYVFISLVLSNVQDVTAQKNKCMRSEMFPTGPCGNNGEETCKKDFKNIYRTPIQCKCLDKYDFARLCDCRFC